jgi:hypothetical protein
MKIDYAVVSTDGNELYDGFWELCKKTWSQIVGVKPLLVIIEDEDKIVESDDSIIVEFKKVENISTALQSQIARIYVTSLFKNKSLLISDLDMIPMSKSYFVDHALNVKDDQILIYTADAYGYNHQIRYPMCYNLAYGSLYTEIFDLDCSYEEFVKRLKSLNFEREYDTDELYFGMCVRKFELENSERIVKLHRGFRQNYATNRIDREYWFTANYDFNKVPEQFYYDCHLLRPYKKYKNDIDNLINLLLK